MGPAMTVRAAPPADLFGSRRIRTLLIIAAARNIALGISAGLERSDFRRIDALRQGVGRLAPVGVWAVALTASGIMIIVGLRGWRQVLRVALIVDVTVLAMLTAGYAVATMSLPADEMTWWPFVGLAAFAATDMVLLTGPWDRCGDGSDLR